MKEKDIVGKISKIPFLIIALLTKRAFAETVSLDILSTLNGIQVLLAHIGPILSAILFIVAGIVFALAQLFPGYKRASLHSTAADILVGAIIVAVLSVASNGLALASTHLLSNLSS